jgi:hypothetical protein
MEKNEGRMYQTYQGGKLVNCPLQPWGRFVERGLPRRSREIVGWLPDGSP